MSTLNELERIAAMAHALRPDWPLSSLLTHLKANHGARPYLDLAVAMAWIATDPDTKTPARLMENGPWWAATTPQPAATSSRNANHKPCDRCRYPHPPGEACDIRRDQIDRTSPTYLANRAAARAAALAAAHGTTEQETA
jgi:hypothetical protein